MHTRLTCPGTRSLNSNLESQASPRPLASFCEPRQISVRPSALSFRSPVTQICLRPNAPRIRVVTRVFDKMFGTGLFQAASGTPSAPSASLVLFSTSPPSWETLGQLLSQHMEQTGVNFLADPNLGRTHPAALKRTFGQPESKVRVKLYRDHAAWCPYCQKVWLQLEEKRIPYVVEKINMRCYGDKPASFMAKVPGGLLPVIELDGQVVTESSVIMNLLEEEFTAKDGFKELMPPKGTPERVRADALMRLERQFFSDWLGWLCNGWDYEGRKRRFEATMDVVCRELQTAGGPFFLGKDISLVDITFTPMLERGVASLAYYKGYFMRGEGRWPALDRWFEAMELRDTYLGTKSDFYTHCQDLPPQMGGCAMAPPGEPVAAQIAGLDGVTWHLPLPPLGPSSLPEPYGPGERPAEDRLEAAAKMVQNHTALVRFALRGPGKPGPRPVSAPLADPSALPAMEHEAAMDAALRWVAHALIQQEQLGQPLRRMAPGSEGGRCLRLSR